MRNYLISDFEEKFEFSEIFIAIYLNFLCSIQWQNQGRLEYGGGGTGATCLGPRTLRTSKIAKITLVYFGGGGGGGAKGNFALGPLKVRSE